MAVVGKMGQLFRLSSDVHRPATSALAAPDVSQQDPKLEGLLVPHR